MTRLKRPFVRGVLLFGAVLMVLTSDVLGQGPTLIPQAGWTLVSVDSQDATGHLGVHAFDGNAGTFWHTQWSGGSPPHPHEITINLGGMYHVSGFRYLPRQDGFPHGRIGQYEVYVSLDGTTWGAAVSAGTLANISTQQEVLLTTPKTGQYMRLRALTEVEGRPYTSMAELNVLQSGNRPPNGEIDLPTSNVTIAPGGTVSFSGPGTDPENDALTYRWTFGAGGPPDALVEDPGAVQFPAAGVYTVTFTVRDSTNQPDPVPPTRTITVQTGGPPQPPVSLIPQTGWSLVFADSQAAGFGATRAFEGSPSTFWHTEFVRTEPPP